MGPDPFAVKAFMDVHLMIAPVDPYIEAHAEAGGLQRQYPCDPRDGKRRAATA